MGEKEQLKSPQMPSSSNAAVDSQISGIKEKHRLELESLTLATQPFKTLNFFTVATGQYLKCSISYLPTNTLQLALSTLFLVLGVLLFTIDGPHEKHVKELLHYLQFGLWWVALGVASSIGLGSGLHTFVLYLGPHIALFTIKAMQCGRVDLKTAPYDTIQLGRDPSWLDKDCTDFGPPVFSSSHGLSVPLSSILPQLQLEAVLWGIGTALGELPPYFISRAACISGSKVDAMEEFDDSSKEDGIVTKHMSNIKRWFFAQSQHLNFFTILVLASVPNPLFDLAGIMCGQFGIPFWKFFFATLTGKAIIKTHIQTVFIVSVCNNQLLEWMENEMIWALGFIPGLSSILPKVIAKVHLVKQKYLIAPVPAKVPDAQGNNWDLSLSSIWGTIVSLVLVNFFIKIVTSTAQSHLKKQQDMELQAVTEGLSSSQQSGEKLSSIN